MLGVACAVALVGLGAGLGAGAGAATPIRLVLPQGDAFAIVGYDCGGIAEQAFATGFDPSSGYPTGDVYLRTSCSSGGRGAPPSIHTAWASTTWDFTGADGVVRRTLDGADRESDAGGLRLERQRGLQPDERCLPAPRRPGSSRRRGSPRCRRTPAPPRVAPHHRQRNGFQRLDGGGFRDQRGVQLHRDGRHDHHRSRSDRPHSETVDITVSSAGGTSATSPSDQFTLVAPPTVTG